MSLVFAHPLPISIRMVGSVGLTNIIIIIITIKINKLGHNLK